MERLVITSSGCQSLNSSSAVGSHAYIVAVCGEAGSYHPTNRRFIVNNKNALLLSHDETFTDPSLLIPDEPDIEQ
jgi:hypothetical protein